MLEEPQDMAKPDMAPKHAADAWVADHPSPRTARYTCSMLPWLGTVPPDGRDAGNNQRLIGHSVVFMCMSSRRGHARMNRTASRN